VKLQGKAAIVTGGGTGVGRATALALAERGCRVLVNYSRSAAEAEATAAEVRARGVPGIAFRADVADDAACRAMAARAVAEFGRLDVLVNNAGTTSFIPHADLEKVTDADWDKILAVNLKGPFQACALPARRGAGEAVVVNRRASPAWSASAARSYCVSKAGSTC
jgi:3-oxoacyl-[acyl-carrier protein] reductase